MKAFAHVGADLTGTVHWAQHCKAHACLRDVLRLGVKAQVHRDQWEGCTPLMLAAAQNDTYGMQLLFDHADGNGDGSLTLEEFSEVRGPAVGARARAAHPRAPAGRRA